MKAIEALTRYHLAELRLAEIERAIEREKDGRPMGGYQEHRLQALYLERDRLQAESFRVFTEARRLG